MPAVIDFIEYLSHLHIELEAVDGRLKVTAPQGAVTPEIQTIIKHNKAALLTCLQPNGTAPQEAPDRALSGHGVRRLSFSSSFGARLAAFGRKTGNTPDKLFMAALGVLLTRYGRPYEQHLGLPRIDGPVSAKHTVHGGWTAIEAITLDLTGNPPFQAVLKGIGEMRANGRQGIHEKSAAGRPSILFNYRDVPDKPLSGVGPWLTPLVLNPDREIQLELSIYQFQDGPAGLIVYDPESFSPEFINRMEGHLTILLTSVLDQPDQPIEEIPILTPQERDRLLVAFNDTARDYPRDKCLHQLFEEQAARTPDEICLVYGDDHLTYDGLNRRSNQLAHYLIRQGLGPDQLAAICIERSPELVVAIWGVLKAGGAYIPIDISYPKERIEYILEDAAPRMLLTQDRLKKQHDGFKGNQVICLDRDQGLTADEPATNPQTAVTPENLCNVIYTSGSTGRPKGAMIIHRGLVNYFCSALNDYQVPEGSGVPVHRSIGFDATAIGIYIPLLAGAKIVLLREGEDVEGLRDVFTARAGYSLLSVTPSHLELLSGILDEKEITTDAKTIILGGEQLLAPILTPIRRQAPQTRLYNEYGPTETSIGCCRFHIGDRTFSGPVPIGRPIANTRLYILDRHLNPVPLGVPGELYIAGDGVGRGYLNRPALTRERFIPNPFDEAGAPMYKTGDQARYLPDGNVEFMGRIDFQVKIRGHRIELGEIEARLLAHSGVREAVVAAREDSPGNRRLVAYVVPKTGQAPTRESLRAHLETALPDYMIPATLVFLDRMPLNPNGKIDRQALPRPIGTRPELATEYVKPRTDTEKALADQWQGLLQLDRVGIFDHFFELGGNSLLAVQCISLLKKKRGLDLPITGIFKHPRIKELADFLDHRDPQKSPGRPAAAVVTRPAVRSSKPENRGVAIVGLAGRFPGAANVQALWNNICQGFDSIQSFTDDQLDPGIPRETREDPDYVRAKGIIDGADRFDAHFFGISAREAEIMDPQQRVFLETAWAALEDAGHVPESFPGIIGVYGGTGVNTYLRHNVLTRPDRTAALGDFQTTMNNEKDYVATRTSYLLNLSGPSISLNTACSTSLVAVCQAVAGLVNGDCDLALAGGVNISSPIMAGYIYQEGGMVSPDGHCRPFDVHSAGTVFNDGVGLVVLRRLEDALADHDRIWAVIRGTALNNDGAQKVSFTAPSVDGQAAVIARAQEIAGVDPGTITYLETHGTATPLGDPIEVEALTQAFRAKTDGIGFCGLGSIKSNIGHLVTASGVAGLIKTALSLYHKTIPPTVHFTAPNPRIDFNRSPFYVVDRLTPWPASETPRRAGVSSFGVGGTNAHAVLEEAPPMEASGPSRPYQLLLLSARTDPILETAADQLADAFRDQPQLNLADAAFTLQTGRRGFSHRQFLVCRNKAEAIEILGSRKSPHSGRRVSRVNDPDIVFMFPGQGVQYVNMGLTLYRDEPVFREQVDRCAEILQPLLKLDLRRSLYPEDGDQDQEAEVLKQTFFTQPAIFTIEFALAKLFNDWGVWPEAMIGHSIGEFAAACLAGVFSLEDALTIVAARGRLMQDLPAGSMLSVRLPASKVEPLMGPDLALAAVNGPALCVVSGPTDRIDALGADLEKQGVPARPLKTSHAFHSAMMDPMVEPLGDVVRSLSLSPPLIPILSTVTGDWMTPEQATDPMYWARHARATVRFSEGIQRLWENPERVLLELGPRNTSATLARQHAADLKKQTAIATLDGKTENHAEWASVLNAVGRLWLNGVQIDWDRFYRHETRHRVPLPTYPFERQRFWLEAGSMPAPGPEAPVPLSNERPVEAPLSGETMNQTRPNTETESRKDHLTRLIKEIMEDISGENLEDVDPDLTFLEMGFDSLLLTQAAMTLQKKFKVKITFRQLIDQFSSHQALAEYLDQELPPEAFAPQPAAPVLQPGSEAAPGRTPVETLPDLSYMESALMNQPVDTNMMERIIGQQLQVMSRQLEMLRQGAPIASLPSPADGAAPARPAEPEKTDRPVPAPPKRESGRAFGPGARIETVQKNPITPAQQAQLDAFIEAYTSRTKGSKTYTQQNRAHLADPRAVSGFTPAFKEMVYPIVVNRSSGARLWDVDGNEYVDLLNGFGSNFFGYSPPFITEALEAQLKKGIEIGPQAALVGEIAGQICEFTGMERAAFCNTGSEAVLGVMRLARTVTGRNTIVMFNGAYHGIFNEVIVRPTAKGSLPAAPGIPPSAVENIVALDYGTPESLEYIRKNASELAAVLVEPVQGRRPDFQPREFLQELRHITADLDTALIFDEVITGFRMHPGGVQALFGIQADLATYGKVIGGGLPLGVLAGKHEYMDALDGGFWQFGDDSIPEVGVTYFAGTFVRHPLALAAAQAVLGYLKEKGPGFQEALNEKTGRLVETLKEHIARVGAPIKIPHFGSLFYMQLTRDLPYGPLIFHWLRSKGVHIWEHRPCFLTEAHTEADMAFIIDAFKESIAEMQAAGFLPGPPPDPDPAQGPPVPGAKLGRDPLGNPAWYIPDPERPGKYLQINNES